MYNILVARIIQNSLWLVLAIPSGMMMEKLIFSGYAAISIPDNVVFGLIVLSATLLTEYLIPCGVRKSAALKQNMVLVLLASMSLFVVAQVREVFVTNAEAIAITLFLFVLLRGFFQTLSGYRVCPDWLSTKVLLLGEGPVVQELSALIEQSNGRYKVCKTIEISEKGTIPGAGDSSLARQVKKSGATRIVVCLNERRGIMPMKEILQCRLQGLEVVNSHDFYEQLTRKLNIEKLTPSCFIFSTGFVLSPLRRALKRCVDIAAALAGLFLALPLLPLIALAVRLDSPGPALFRQIRTGLNGRPFQIIKFRTMRQDAESATGAVWASRHDPRVTRIGGFLRKTRMDEIPQLINVLIGDMSLVGPRPERPEFIRDLEKTIPFYSVRHCVKPGVTGWAQVCYPYGSSTEDALEKLRYDLFYIKNSSVFLDAEIILKTILVVLSGNGAR